MGSFYTNITLRTERHDDVVSLLRDEGREAFVSRPQRGCVVVYDRECEDQDIEVLKKLGGLLSTKLRCAALGVLNHDDDVLIYMLHDNGKLVDEYNSSPAYFDSGPGEPPEGGDASRLGSAFGIASTGGIEEVLHMPNGGGSGDGYIFESERHQALAEALGTPAIAVHTGFNYIEEGELPDGVDSDTFTRID
jgi:hypothetical protein